MKILRSFLPRASAVDYVALRLRQFQSRWKRNFPKLSFRFLGSRGMQIAPVFAPRPGQRVKRFHLPADIHVSKCSAASMGRAMLMQQIERHCARTERKANPPLAECLHDVSAMAFLLASPSRSTSRPHCSAEALTLHNLEKETLMHSEHGFVSEIFDYLLH
jgi:hypothetical protein